MFPTFYLLLVLVVFPSDHITRWDRAALQDQTKTMTFPMLDQAACENTAAMVRGAVQVAGTYPEGTTVITRCQSVTAYQSAS
jgi:hypothetical protein